MLRRPLSQSSMFMVAGLAVLAAGALHYIAFRHADETVIGEILRAWIGPVSFGADKAGPAGAWASSAPTMLHVIAFVLLTWAVTGLSRTTQWLAPTFWMLVNTLFELGQNPAAHVRWWPGTFDVYDIYAAILGGFVVFAIGKSVLHRHTSGTCRDPATTRRVLFAGTIIPAGMFAIVGSYVVPMEYSNEPIYMSYDELRAAVKIESSRPLTTIGKLYTYQNWVLVNEPNQGVHMFDYTDPAQPRYHAFIVVPGSVDVAVRDGYLYVDSFIDLVTIDINDPANIREINRVVDVFPYDAYQMIPNYIWFESVDPTKGVVIGYTTKNRNGDDNRGYRLAAE